MPGRKTQTYSEIVKQGAIVIAVREGVAEASRRLKIPQTTLYNWLRDAGGLVEIRNLASMRAEEALSEAERSVYHEVVRRMAAKEMADTEIMVTFRALIEARVAGPHVQASSAAGAQASANVWNINVSD